MKKETLEDTAKKFTENLYYKVGDADEFNGEPLAVYDAFIAGANYQAERMYSEEPKPTIKQVDYVAKKQERMYSEEDMKQFAFECVANFLSNNDNKVEIKLVDVIIDRLNPQFEQFKKK
jgi:hypothetical protein